MNKLLPTKEELKPIVKPLNTFYECGFNTDFDTLSEKKQLQILCDMVKETVYPNKTPNPETELEELNGNSYTACEVLESYLKELKIGKKVKTVIASGRPFDIEASIYAHPVVLVETEEEKIYQVDPAPFVGYKIGSVEEVPNPYYQTYTDFNEDMKKYIKTFKEILYREKENNMDYWKINEYIDQCVMAILNYPILKGYSCEALKALLKYIKSPIVKERIAYIIKESTPEEKQLKAEQRLLEKQRDLWIEELSDLKGTEKQAKRQLELSQWIIQEGKRFHPELEKERIINGNRIKLSMINPRVLYELGYNTIFIKTSAFFLGCQDRIRNSYIEKYPYTGEYSVNLSMPTEQTGIKPMLFSHPLGENCARSLNGETRVLLIEADPESIYKQKKQLREEICGPLWGKDLIWFDGKPIRWDPMITNIMHGTDHAPEAALHYLVANPEHQNMTRFMVPNPKLKYKEKTR